MNPFDIYIAFVSWESKMRPVLVLEQTEMLVYVFNITTQYENKSDKIRANFFKIQDWQQAGLDKQSYIDTNSIRDLPLQVLAGKPIIGKLTDCDVQRLGEFLSKRGETT
ncbi:MAG: hypothetical protein FWD35_03660 [Oscillospiraceae bacterium]|nr:hypothetical protein [Oscillospiraceae bacterium]